MSPIPNSVSVSAPVSTSVSAPVSTFASFRIGDRVLKTGGSWYCTETDSIPDRSIGTIGEIRDRYANTDAHYTLYHVTFEGHVQDTLTNQYTAHSLELFTLN